MREFLLNRTADGRNISLDLDMASLRDRPETTLRRAAKSIAKSSGAARPAPKPTPTPAAATPSAGYPRRIRFPYSRHSSYPELCEFVAAFRPRDVWPCTVNPVEWMDDGMAHLSGTSSPLRY